LLLLAVNVGIMYFLAVENLLPDGRNDAGGPYLASHLVIVFFNVVKAHVLKMFPFCTPVVLEEGVPSNMLLRENISAVDARIIAWVNLFSFKPDVDDVNEYSGEFMARVKGGQFGTEITEESSAPYGTCGMHAAKKVCLGVCFQA
jgi:hypothetical protein